MPRATIEPTPAMRNAALRASDQIAGYLEEYDASSPEAPVSPGFASALSADELKAAAEHALEEAASLLLRAAYYRALRERLLLEEA